MGALDNLGLTKKPVAAYGLRRLFGDYAGPQVRVRRSLDNLEAKVSFDRHGKLTWPAWVIEAFLVSGYAAKTAEGGGFGDV